MKDILLHKGFVDILGSFLQFSGFGRDNAQDIFKEAQKLADSLLAGPIHQNPGVSLDSVDSFPCLVDLMLIFLPAFPGSLHRFIVGPAHP